MKRCPNCGYELEDSAVFCYKCGERMPEDFVEEYKTDEVYEQNYSYKANLKKPIIIFTSIVAVGLLILLIIFSSISSNNNNDYEVPEETPAVEEPVEIDKSKTLSEYASSYKYSLRSTVDYPYINRSVSDADYISCAKTLINKRLKNPSTAQYNSSSVYEKDDYGKAIVYLDVSAQNSFGGWVRDEYYVCINSMDSDGTFTYSSTMPYVEKSSDIYLLKLMNDFDEHPADSKLDGLLMSEEDLVFVDTQTASSKKLDYYRFDFDFATKYVYVDTTTKKVHSVLLKFNSYANKEKVKKLCVASSSAFSGEGNSTSEDNVSTVLNLNSLSPFGSSDYYKDGFVYSCVDVQGSILYSVTMMKEDEYKTGNYWTPTSSMPDASDNIVVPDDPNIIDTNAGNNDNSYVPNTEQPSKSTQTYTNPNPINSGDTITLTGVIRKSYMDEYYIEGTSVTYVYHIDENGVKHKFTDNKVYFSTSDNSRIQKYVGQNVVVKGTASPQSHGVLMITNISII